MSDSVYTRLNSFTQMVYSACHMPVWCFGMRSRKRHYTSCPDADNFEMFLKLSGCLDYAYEKVEDMHRPALLSDSLGMLYIAEYVFEEEEGKDYPALLILMGPYFDSEKYAQDVIRALNREDLSVETRLRMKQTFREIPVLNLNMGDQYAAMLQCAIAGEPVVFRGFQYMHREKDPAEVPDAKSRDTEKDREKEEQERVGTEQALKAVRDGDIEFIRHMRDGSGAPYMQNDKSRAVPDLRRDRDDAIVNITICCLAAQEGGLGKKTAESMRDSFIDQTEKAGSLPELMSVMSKTLTGFIGAVHEIRQEGKGEISKPIQDVCEYIRRNAAGEITLAEIAKQVGYTEYYLTKKFYKEMGIKLTDYIKKERTDLAGVWLVSTDRSIEEISDSLGFANRGYFSRVFKEATGMSPSQYRANVFRTGKQKEEER